jgi:Spa2 homology domain (SHD) of GIT
VPVSVKYCERNNLEKRYERYERPRWKRTSFTCLSCWERGMSFQNPSDQTGAHSTNDLEKWSGISKYQSQNGDSPYVGGQRGPATPPTSGGPGSMNGGLGGMSRDGTGAPSPPASIARSSDGNGLYARSDGGKSSRPGPGGVPEEALSQHYQSLRRFLASSLFSAEGKARPNRARDKLLRLSSVQFQELSRSCQTYIFLIS